MNNVICKQCASDYLESENYKWSCRTHKSEFSGEMYWCCGKTTKEALGCKFDYHVARHDDDDELDFEAQMKGINETQKQVC